MSAANIDILVKNYIDYYNQCDNDTWSYDKAYKRIHQIMTIEDSDCLIQYDNGEMIGFAMGYYRQFDRVKSYYLEGILIFYKYQNKGYGTKLMEFLENKVRENGAEFLDIITVLDEQHEHFYKNWAIILQRI